MKKTAERRKTARRPVLESFALFVVIPKKGMHRLQVHDVSESGIGFNIDAEGEGSAESPVVRGEMIDLQFYLNQSLYLPLTVRVQRVEEKDEIRRVGAEFPDKEKSSKEFKAFHSFITTLDQLLGIAKVASA